MRVAGDGVTYRLAQLQALEAAAQFFDYLGLDEFFDDRVSLSRPAFFGHVSFEQSLSPSMPMPLIKIDQLALNVEAEAMQSVKAGRTDLHRSEVQEGLGAPGSAPTHGWPAPTLSCAGNRHHLRSL